MILVDTDMGSDCDDAGALALLHRYADLGDAEILGCIYSSGKVPYGAGIIDAINTYYGRSDLPIGACHDPDFGDPEDKMLAAKLAADRAAYGHRIVKNEEVPEMTRLARELLAGQPDGSVTYLSIGHLKGLHDLLLSPPDEVSPLSGRELIAAKVKVWVAMGALHAKAGGPEYRFDWNFTGNGSGVYAAPVVGTGRPRFDLSLRGRR